MMTPESLRDAFKYLYPDELPELRRLVQMLPDNPLVVNIGSGAGTSGLTIITARPDVSLLTIDIQDESSPFGCLVAERQVFEDAGLADLYNVRWLQLHGDSTEFARHWNLTKRMVEMTLDNHANFTREPQMVFVDGDHSYEHAASDIEFWLKLLQDDGIIAVHDYRKAELEFNENGPHPVPWPGVDQAVDDWLRDKYPLISRVDSLISFRKAAL